ncbi:MAG TPA: helix-turn-helix transcriptional regulator [Thermoanaerobaculia bacterium]
MPKAPITDPDAVCFGQIVQRLRLQRGWQIQMLARRCDMNANYLGVLEKGGNTPTLRTIFALAEVFGVDAWEIVREVEQQRREAQARLGAAMLAKSRT